MTLNRLDLNSRPQYGQCDYRQFFAGEHHVNRICRESVLILMLSGCLRFEENRIPIELETGDWYIQPAGLLQSGPRSSDLPFYLYIHFSGVWLPENSINAETADRQDYLVSRGRFDPAEFRPHLDELWRLQVRQPDCRFGLQALFDVLLYRLSRQPLLIKPADRRGEAIVRAMEAQYREKITIEELAAEFHYTPDHLIRKVHELCGQTPYQYIRSLRLRFACQQLLLTNRTLAVIADEAGFADTAALYRAFQDVYGLSPSGWRERERRLP
ncbi:MAG: AraC family transcriptional regulator [Clostridiaceae bacterium]|nr:AraC family transcriptional regulator [Clostridiaceae bacterium]